jgi:hypothetical protein
MVILIKRLKMTDCGKQGLIRVVHGILGRDKLLFSLNHG